MNKKLHSLDIDLLIENNQGLVYHLAMKINRRLPVRQDLDDLIGYGMIGLVEAANKFKESRGIEFSTFAFPRINGAIYDGVSKLSWMSRSRYNRLMRTKTQAESNGDTEAAQKADHELVNVSSLDPESAKMIAESDGDSAEMHMTREENGQMLQRLIADLPDRERRLITMVYIEGHSLLEASKRLGVSKSWGSRMHSKTLTNMAMSVKGATLD